MFVVVIAMASCGCASRPRPPVTTGAPQSTLRSIALPGAPPDGAVAMDYIAYDGERHRLWVPAGNTGNVDVVDEGSGKVLPIGGFPTSEMERRGTKRIVGPSSATIGEGTVYVGNRGDSRVCAVDAVTLHVGACVRLDSMPDGLLYVPSLKELWVTTPRDQSIVVLDASSAGALAIRQRVAFDGEPEGFALDDARGIFYTNLEDKNRTLAIDVKTRAVVQTWLPGCGEDGPKGLAIDRQWRFLMVACSDGVVVLDAGHGGVQLAKLGTGDGVDNIDYLPSRHELYVAAARAARLTTARLDARGTLTVLGDVPTAPGVRNAVATEAGLIYLTDARRGSILVVGSSSREP